MPRRLRRRLNPHRRPHRHQTRPPRNPRRLLPSTSPGAPIASISRRASTRTHWHSDPAHVDHQELILGEWNITETWLVGASYFKNSFGQPSEYVYGGYRFRPFEKVQPLYIKVSAGLVHGYKDPYKDKIPFNGSGIAPVIIPSVGYCINRFCGEVVIAGGASVVLTLGVTLP